MNIQIPQINNSYSFNNHNNNQNFKGYGARPLDKIVIRNPRYFPVLYKITKELIEISKNYSFKVLSEGNKVYENIADMITYHENTASLSPWIQDIVSVVNDKIFYKGGSNIGKLHDYLGMEYRKVNSEMYITGGNTFILDNTVLVGENEKIQDVKSAFDKKKIIRVPQADFHLDLFIRPLKDNVVLATDDNMTIDILQEMYDVLSNNRKNNLEKMVKIKKCIKEMSSAMNLKKYSSTEDVIKSLEKDGFKVVRVPGRIIKRRDDNKNEISNVLNYMNAIVHEEPNENLVYITNKSTIMQRLGIKSTQSKALNIDIEQFFIDSIKDYIKPKNIHFINGNLNLIEGPEGSYPYYSIQYILENLQGGIHCLSLEVPKKE